MKKAKTKRSLGEVLAFTVLNIITFLSSMISVLILFFAFDEIFGEESLLAVELASLALFFLSVIVQTIIHEAGHLLAGLISGYSFSSFRVGRLMLVREGEGLRLRLNSVPGTLGQCLMAPPRRGESGNYPVIFYNLGGSVLNLVSSALFLAVALGVQSASPIAFAILCSLALVGFSNALTNGIPMKTALVNNDGSNALELSRSAEAREIFYNQFEIIGLMTSGKRLREMPDGLFLMPSTESLTNSIAASGAVLCVNRLLDEGKYAEAAETADKILLSENGLVGIHRAALTADRITLGLLLGESLQKIEELRAEDNYSKIAKKMKNSISFIRTEYAYARLSLGDGRAAETARERFEKFAKVHPYTGDVESERELLSAIDKEAELGSLS